MKALETSVGLGAISTLVEDCREPNESARGKKRRANFRKTSATVTNFNRLRYIRIHIPCYGQATGTCHYASSHTLLGRVSGISRLIRNVPNFKLLCERPQ